ncbi:hypothetical protein BsWGS_26742 [Bradybaena similaris]
MAKVSRKVCKKRKRSPTPPRRQRRKACVKKVARGAKSGGRSRAGRRVQVKGSRKSRGRSRSRRAKARCVSSDFNIPLHVPAKLQEITFETYLRRVLKKVKPELAIKKESLQMMDNLMKDTLHKLAKFAATKLGKRKTLQPKVILRAMKKFMPKSLVDQLDEYAREALDSYDRNR